MYLEPKKMSKKFDKIKNNLIFAAPLKHCFAQSIEGKTAPLGAEMFFEKALGFSLCCLKIWRLESRIQSIVECSRVYSVGLTRFLVFTVTPNTTSSGKLLSFALF